MHAYNSCIDKDIDKSEFPALIRSYPTRLNVIQTPHIMYIFFFALLC